MPRAPRPHLERARQLRNEPTSAERRLWMLLRSRQIEGHRFRRQVPIGPYIVDFASVLSHLIIEVDGSQHTAAEDYDERRTAFLRAKGYKVIRFWDNDVLEKGDEVAEAIRTTLRS